MKKILLLAYHFPPENNGGTGRPYSFYKYLPTNGYKAIVLTQSVYGHLSDENHIYRVDAISDWRRSGFISKKKISKVLFKILNTVGFISIDDWLWQINAQKIKSKIFSFQKPDVIFATYPPIDTLVLGLKFSAEYNVPLIADFRDGFLIEPLKKPNLIQNIFLKKFEKKVVKHASAVTTVGENLSQYFIDNYKQNITYTIFNGYDKGDFGVSVKNKKKDTKCKIVHFGTINYSRKRDVKFIFTTIKRLKDEKIISESNFELSFIGRYTPYETKVIHDLHLADLIKINGPIDKSEGFRRIASQYKYLLLIGMPEQTTLLSSKLMEYIYLDKPIVGICKGNEAEKIIRRTQTGEVYDFNEASVYQAFMRCLNNKIVFRPDRSEISKFDREYQTRTLADVLDNVE